jgi:hypothetical protein
VCSVSCGGVTDAKCQAGTYCHYLDGICGAGQATGTRDAVPTSFANAPQNPVGGCDKKPTSIECPLDQYCDLGAMGACLNANPTGTCAVPPDTCAPGVDYVCGCDGKDYVNTCYAAQSGTSVVGKGKCKPLPDAGVDGG